MKKLFTICFLAFMSIISLNASFANTSIEFKGNECEKMETLINFTANLTPFATCIGSNSISQSFTVSATGVNTSLQVIAPVGYSISTTNSNFFSPIININATASGEVPITTIYIVLNGLNEPFPQDQIYITANPNTSAATSAFINVQATLNPNNNVYLDAVNSITYTNNNFNISFRPTATLPRYYSITSTTPTQMSGFIPINNSRVFGSNINVPIPLSKSNDYNFILTFSSGNQLACPDKSYPFVLKVTGPKITITSSLNTFETCEGFTSSKQSFTIAGSELIDNIIINAPNGFEISTNANGSYGNSITLNQSGGIINSTIIYVRLTANASNSSTTNIVCSTTGSSNNIAVNGIINSGTHNVVTQTSCDSYFWHGMYYTSSGHYIYNYNNTNGCSSVDTLKLSILKSSNSNTNLILCSNQLPYTWNGLTFTAAGTQTAHLTNAAGCDSAATLNLTLKQSTLSTTNKAYCQSELPTTWNGLTIAAAGTYTVHLTNAAGCDSAATLVATLKAGPLAIINYSNGVNVTTMGMCNIGDSIQVANYTAPGGVWTSSNPGVASVAPTASYNRVAKVKAIGVGTVTISYGGITSSGGCPSTINMQVTVMPITTPAAIIGSGTACLNTATSFSNATSDGIWSASRGTITTNGDYTPTSVGTGVITYTLSNVAGCSKSVSKSVTINTQPAIPSINFATGTTGVTGTGGYCTNRTFTLVGTPTGGVWSKTGVINITSGGVVTTTSLTGAASATYTVTNAAGCSNSRTISTAIVACSPRGISTQSAMSNEQLVIYPNPAHNVVNLNIKALSGVGSIVVTDLFGKQIKQQPLSISNNTIDVSNFARGMYLVSIITEQGKQTQKLIVE